MRTLWLIPFFAALAAPVPADSTEATVYLAPRERGVTGRPGFDEAPSDVESPADWRRGVPGAEETDYHERSSH